MWNNVDEIEAQQLANFSVRCERHRGITFAPQVIDGACPFCPGFNPITWWQRNNVHFFNKEKQK